MLKDTHARAGDAGCNAEHGGDQESGARTSDADDDVLRDLAREQHRP
jgi:hypothetical protein